MNFWRGTAACCLNEDRKILMALQGKPDEEPKWSVPSGGVEHGETLEECCIREVWEETGYRIRIDQKLFEKRGQSYGWDVEVHYFRAAVVAGSACIQDSDGLIHEVGWKSRSEITNLNLAFPEDRDFLIQFADDGI